MECPELKIYKVRSSFYFNRRKGYNFINFITYMYKKICILTTRKFSVNSQKPKFSNMEAFKRNFSKILALAIVFTLCLLGSNDLIGQNVDKNVAKKEARENKREAGFESINFSKARLNQVLSNAAAVRLFNGIPNSARSAVLMIIGLDANGNEIGDTFIQSDENGVSVDLSRAVKELQVTNAENDSKVTAFSTSFSKENIEQLINSPGVDGIDFSPSKVPDADGNAVLSLTASPTGSSSAVESMSSFRSPCPPECFNGDN